MRISYLICDISSPLKFTWNLISYILISSRLKHFGRYYSHILGHPVVPFVWLAEGPWPHGNYSALAHLALSRYLSSRMRTALSEFAPVPWLQLFLNYPSQTFAIFFVFLQFLVRIFVLHQCWSFVFMQRGFTLLSCVLPHHHGALQAVKKYSTHLTGTETSNMAKISLSSGARGSPSWLRHYATSCKVAGSIPDGGNWIFQFI
jgi:hypothetical protein